MRALRSFKPDRWYHLISRIANRAFYLTDEECTRFVERLWRVAKFSGIEIPAYCLMSDHFHLLVHLPEAPELGDGGLFDRIAASALVDALTGAIYEVGPGTIGKTSYVLPIYDSPLLMMDGSLATGKGKE